MAAITDAPAMMWDDKELAKIAMFPEVQSGTSDALSQYNPTPGSGRTGYLPVPPNNYPFYSDDEKYIPVMQADGGQLSEWKPMYHPTTEQAEADRKKAYETGVPHGYVAPGDKYKDLPTIKLTVVSDLHTDDEYGAKIDVKTGQHSGGPFTIDVSPKMRVEELRKVIRDKGGIIPALQRLSYAGKNLEDSQRTLEQYGIAYWHQRFPAWPLKIRKFDSNMQSFSAFKPSGARLPVTNRSRRLIVVHSKKGFGEEKSSSKSKSSEESGSGQSNIKRRANRTKGKQAYRQPIANSTPIQRTPVASSQLLQPDQLKESVVDNIEFEQRLNALKQISQERRADVKSSSAVYDPLAALDPLARPDKDDPYANPPPLTQTLFGSTEKSASDKDYEGTNIGPGQVGLAVASLALVGVFLITSGGSELGYASKRRSSSTNQQPVTELSQETKDELTNQLKTFDQTLVATPDDAEALEGAAVVNARLGKYDKAEKLLEKLTKQKADSPDIWRVLAESRSALGKSTEAIDAYKQAWKASNQGSLEILQGLIQEMVGSGQEKQAVDMLKTMASVGNTNVGEVELQLLLAKVYGQWKGHIPDALAQYDVISEAHPDDFRAPLGKGLTLLQDGNTVEGQRYFLQARYLAPKSSRSAVEAIISQALGNAKS